jgi:hypothetical protein
MATLTTDTFERPADLTDAGDPRVLYAQSYLLTRMLVGLIGIALPLVFIIGEAWFLSGNVQVRPSLSAYYHTAMRDVFVAALSVTGFLLITYLSAQRDTWDFWLSFVAGVAVLGVVFFPTARPDLLTGSPPCGTTPVPPGCSPVQQQLGEALVSGIHLVCAAVFILSLAAIAFLFAQRERVHLGNVALARVLATSGWLILAAVAWAVVGSLLDLAIWGLTPLYVGEVVAVWSFGVAWVLKGRDLFRTAGTR